MKPSTSTSVRTLAFSWLWGSTLRLGNGSAGCSHCSLFRLMRFDRCSNAVKKPREPGEINLRGVFADVYRENMLSEISYCVLVAISIKGLSTELQILNLVREAILYR